MQQGWINGAWVNNSIWETTFDVNNFLISTTFKVFTAYNQVIGRDSTYNYFHTVINGIEDLITPVSSINVYPNPTSGKLRISSESPIGTVEIYNLPGDRIFSNLKLCRQTSGEIDLSGFAKGIYIMKISDGRKTQAKKIIVQ